MSLIRERARSPAQGLKETDTRARVVPAWRWLALAGGLAVVAAILLWSIFSAVKVEVQGKGLLEATTEGSAEVESPLEATVTETLVAAGDDVRAGDPLVRVEPLSGGASRALTANIDGRVATITVAEGSVVDINDLVAIVVPTGELEAVIYVPASEGGEVKEGQEVLVAPESANQDDGFVVGEVQRVGEFPVPIERLELVLGGEDLAQDITGGVPTIEVDVSLNRDDSDPSGYEWTTDSSSRVGLSAGLLVEADVILREQRPIQEVVS